MLVEINEFFEWKDFRDKDFYQLTEQLEEALNNKDTQILSKLKSYLYELSDQKGQYIYQIIARVLEVIICELKQLTVPQDTIFQLTDYFISLEYWTNLDVGLLGNLVPYFTSDALIVLTNTILEDTPQSLKNNLDRIKIDTVLNCLSVFLERKERNASRKLLTLLFNKNYPTHFSFEKLYLLELKAIFDYLWGDKEEALKIHQTILETINIILNPEAVKEWDDNFRKNTSQLA